MMSGETHGATRHARVRRIPAWPGRAGRARGPRRRTGLLGAAAVAAALALVPGAVLAGSSPPRPGAAARSTSTEPGLFVTLLFSRTEITAADNCVENDAGVARLDTTVAPYMQSLGLTGTGTVVTDDTYDNTLFCTRYHDDLTASWADDTNLAQNYGWSFVSHTATYPTLKQIENFTPAQAYAETCGTITTLESHGLPGAAGMIAYPGSYTRSAAVKNLQKQDGQTCFDWGRGSLRSAQGVTDSTAASTSPYWSYAIALGGGACNDPAAACYTLHVRNSERYSLPSRIIARIEALQPGQWFTLQAYLLVTGTNPKYTSDGDRWDCTSSNPADHWTNVAVRYCWSDYQQILQAIAADPAITVTDPQTVAAAWGRQAG
jgi:hypothetical protein